MIFDEPLTPSHLRDLNLLPPDESDKIVPVICESICTYKFAYDQHTVPNRKIDLADAGGAQDQCPNFSGSNQAPLMGDETNLITNGTKDTPPRASATLSGNQPLGGIKNSLATEPELCNQSGLSQGSNKESEYHDSHVPMTKVDKPCDASKS